MEIKRFEEIESWQEARKLVRDIYQTTTQEDFSKDFGLRDQIRRAAVSIMANIAEGFDSQTNLEFIKFLGYALRSATEVQSHLYVGLDQGYIKEEEFNDLYQQAIKIKNLISGFIRYLKQSSRKS